MRRASWVGDKQQRRFTIWFANASSFLGHFWATFSVVVGCDELQPKNAAASQNVKTIDTIGVIAICHNWRQPAITACYSRFANS